MSIYINNLTINEEGYPANIQKFDKQVHNTAKEFCNLINILSKELLKLKNY